MKRSDILMAATAIVLIVGVIIMGRGGQLNKKYSNKLMQARVAAQALTLHVISFHGPTFFVGTPSIAGRLHLLNAQAYNSMRD